MEAKPISRDSNEKTDKRRTGDSIRRGLVYAGLMLAVSLAAKYAATRGAIHGGDLRIRLVMAIAGAFLVSTGNMIPKTLKPLSAMRCDAARVQSFHRLAGWTWVLAGLALAIGWLVLPVPLAEQMMFLLLPTAIVIIAVLFVRLLRTRPTGA
jgi:hypothetical protein